jgi:hypothetical protein
VISLGPGWAIVWGPYGEVRVSDLHSFFGDKRQVGGLPGIKAAYHVHDIAEAGALQNTASDGAAVTTLAMHGDATIVIERGDRAVESVER